MLTLSAKEEHIETAPNPEETPGCSAKKHPPVSGWKKQARACGKPSNEWFGFANAVMQP